jgi:hypothetical protein
LRHSGGSTTTSLEQVDGVLSAAASRRRQRP